MREADVAIRMAPPRQPELVQLHLLTVHMHVYASPTYIKRHGMPKSAEDLENHKIIVYGDDPRPPVPGINWLLNAGAKKGQPRRPALTVNNVYAIMRAAQSGLGLAGLPEFMVQEASNQIGSAHV